MCMHRLELRISPEYEVLWSQDLGAGLGVPRVSEESIEQALSVAARYLALFPERAGRLRLQQLSCNGCEREFKLPEPSAMEELELIGWAREAWEALQQYADADRYRMSSQQDEQGQLVSSCPALQDGGRLARQALAGGEQVMSRQQPGIPSGHENTVAVMRTYSDRELLDSLLGLYDEMPDDEQRDFDLEGVDLYETLTIPRTALREALRRLAADEEASS